MLRASVFFATAVCATVAFGQPAFKSKVITKQTPGHAVDIKADIAGAKKLWLVVLDGGNGYGCDWADWCEPTLNGKGTTKKLTDLKWKSARTGWGSVRINRNANGQPMKVNGAEIPFGIGTHANSIIEFDLPAGFTTFTARGGLDNGGTDQAGGNQSSVQFLVFTKKPPKNIIPRGGGGGRDAGSRDAKDAIAGLDVHKDLKVTLFASEPMLFSPSNIDVDHKGRVWVAEIVNYRRFRNRDTPERKEGDRILVLEDTDGDGKADKKTTFYQGKDIDSPHGVCVLGNKVIVSAGDSVFVFTDTDGDLKADKKEVLFTGIGGKQHDHGIHAFVFGPDGRLYFNFGNSGRQIKDKNGKQIVDRAGNEVKAHRKPYQEGMIFRCDLDGSNFETLAWNFRNNWEVCVDSFGTMWQSDNDDDGNRGVRINFVMEYGNYGYRHELTGAGWRTPRTNMHPEIPKRHWHQNDPGVVPNLLQTGAGSPTGICVYEGKLLPKVFQNQMIHCDAGPNVVRAYPVKPDGAGYAATIVDILKGTRDKWFRPSDACVGPDGSLFVADWYDAGVGGHRFVDPTRGRIFRVVPKDHDGKYTVPKFDFSTPEKAADALKSPNHAVRYLAFTALKKSGAKAEAALLKLRKDPNPRIQARAIWLLGQLKGRGKATIADALKDKNSDIRIVGLRLARMLGMDLRQILQDLAQDKSPAVRREVAVALAEVNEVAEMRFVGGIWKSLSKKHDGNDRWYLEALQIAIRGSGSPKRRELFELSIATYPDLIPRHGPQNTSPAQRAKIFGDPPRKTDSNKTADPTLFAALVKAHSDTTKAQRDLIWISRAKGNSDRIAKVLLDPKTPRDEVARFLRALDFQIASEAQVALLKLLAGSGKLADDRRSFITAEVLKRLKPENTRGPKFRATLSKLLTSMKGTSQFVSLVEKFKVKERYVELLTLAQEKPTEQAGIDAITALLNLKAWNTIFKGLQSKEGNTAQKTIAALGNSANGKIVGLLMPIMNDTKRSSEIRRAALRAIGKTRNGAQRLVQIAQGKSVDDLLDQTMAAALHSAQWRDIREQAGKLYPLPKTKDGKPLPSISRMLSMKGKVDNGRLLFFNKGTCHKCHQVGKLGREIGPNLSEIGGKLSRKAMLESIVYPSAGVSHNYESWLVRLNDGNTVSGILVSKTDTEVKLKDKEAIIRTFKTDEIRAMKKSGVSMMPADMQKIISAQEMIDIVDYMLTLKKK